MELSVLQYQNNKPIWTDGPYPHEVPVEEIKYGATFGAAKNGSLQGRIAILFRLAS